MRLVVMPALVLAFSIAGCATTAPRERPAPAGPPGRAVWSESDLPETDAAPPRRAVVDGEAAAFDLQARLAVRARSYLGRRGPFRAQGQQFGGDCSGFVEAVYAAEGIMLRGLMQRAAPDERSGVAAAWRAARAHGRVFGTDEWPAPGDLVFWHDTYDRNRNGRTDDRFTHLGIVEYVEEGTVYFLHRGGRGVARGVMTPGRRGEGRDPDGRRLNSPLRAASHPRKDGGLAGELLAGYGRIDRARVQPDYATARVDPFFGAAADRDVPAAGGGDDRGATAAATSAPGRGSGATSTSTASQRSAAGAKAAGKPVAKKKSSRKGAAKQPVAKARTPKAAKTHARGAAR